MLPVFATAQLNQTSKDQVAKMIGDSLKVVRKDYDTKFAALDKRVKALEKPFICVGCRVGHDTMYIDKFDSTTIYKKVNGLATVVSTNSTNIQTNSTNIQTNATNIAGLQSQDNSALNNRVTSLENWARLVKAFFAETNPILLYPNFPK